MSEVTLEQSKSDGPRYICSACRDPRAVAYAAAGARQAARRKVSRVHTSPSAGDQRLDVLVAVLRRRREAQALGAARHGRVVDRLDIDAVALRGARRRRLCTGPDRRPAPARCGSATASPAAGLGQAALQHRRALLMALASTWLVFRWRIAASAPAASAGGSEVVKMKPGAWLRRNRPAPPSRRCSRRSGRRPWRACPG